MLRFVQIWGGKTWHQRYCGNLAACFNAIVPVLSLEFTVIKSFQDSRPFQRLNQKKKDGASVHVQLIYSYLVGLKLPVLACSDRSAPPFPPRAGHRRRPRLHRHRHDLPFHALRLDTMAAISPEHRRQGHQELRSILTPLIQSLTQFWVLELSVITILA